MLKSQIFLSLISNPIRIYVSFGLPLWISSKFLNLASNPFPSISFFSSIIQAGVEVFKWKWLRISSKVKSASIESASFRWSTPRLLRAVQLKRGMNFLCFSLSWLQFALCSMKNRWCTKRKRKIKGKPFTWEMKTLFLSWTISQTTTIGKVFLFLNERRKSCAGSSSFFTTENCDVIRKAISTWWMSQPFKFIIQSIVLHA